MYVGTHASRSTSPSAAASCIGVFFPSLLPCYRHCPTRAMFTAGYKALSKLRPGRTPTAYGAGRNVEKTFTVF